MAVATLAASGLLLSALTAGAASSAGARAGATQAHHPGHHHRHHHGTAFRQVNLVSDIPGLARLTDDAVKNPWGIAFGPDTPLWVNNQFSNVITLYKGANGVDPFAKVPLEVQASSPTGMVFNDTTSFSIDQGAGPVPARFLFNEIVADSPDAPPEGRLTGWAPADPPPTVTAPTAATRTPSAPVGLALVPGGRHRGPRLLVADILNAEIDVYDSRFHEVTGHRFMDPRAAREHLAPYNVMYLRGHVYVAYTGENGGGAVTVFSADGKRHRRLVTGGHLNDPWGMAVAPRHWGRFGGDLLVGNVDDGMINAYDRRTGRFEGTLRDRHGDPLVNLGLWGIAFGNGTIGTPRTLVFAAGIGDEVDGTLGEVYEHGLVGLIKPVRRHHRHHHH